MRDIAFPTPRQLEWAWVAFAALNVMAMVLWPRWETVPFHLIWLTLTLLYGFTVWRTGVTAAVLAGMVTFPGALILWDASHGKQAWGELFEVPLMSAMFLAMVWHARRRQEAMTALAEEAGKRAATLERQEEFLHDVSHELRTPMAIARGHLEIAQGGRDGGAEVDVALDEIGRMQRIVERLMLLAKAQTSTLVTTDVEIDLLLEDVVMRWSGVAARVWRLGDLAEGTLRADPDALRAALDALVENAVQHTGETAVVELSCRAHGGVVAIEVADEGSGVPPGALEHIFDRFARVDPARSRNEGGAGLGLAIVHAIARAHGGRCTVDSSASGSAFTLELPGFAPRASPSGAQAVVPLRSLSS
jgi:two-component system OmpR family sensor kinase